MESLFAYYWPFVRGIHWWTEGSPSQRVTIDVVNLNNPDSKVHGANMGPIWGQQDPGGPHVGPMNFAIWEDAEQTVE